jgi:hypothetical protein
MRTDVRSLREGWGGGRGVSGVPHHTRREGAAVPVLCRAHLERPAHLEGPAPPTCRIPRTPPQLPAVIWEADHWNWVGFENGVRGQRWE